MKCSTVAPAHHVECLSEKLVKIRSRDIKIRTVDITMQRSLHNGNSFRRAIQSKQCLTELVVDARKSIGR
jgi:hypothetical protein